MSKRRKMVQARLNDQEYEKLKEEIAIAGLDMSTYLRKLIHKNEIKPVYVDRELATALCHLYTAINPLEFDGKEGLLQEVDGLCQHFK